MSAHNSFLDGPMPALFAKTALPIIFVTSMNGFLTVADALFLGHFVGQQALAAVTLVFPMFMLIVALSALVAGGMSSVLARHLGGGRQDEAEAVYASAHWLAFALGGLLIVAYVAFGQEVIALAAAHDAALTRMAADYLGILVFTSPLMFALSVNSDALRNEGLAGTMALMSLVVSLSNIGFNYLLIAVLGLGVAGSAIGTVMAQALALGIITVYRVRFRTVLQPMAVIRRVTAAPWKAMLALGAPQSLNFVGAALASTAIIAALQIAGGDGYAVTVSAYGIITRITTFAFLPLMGLAQAMQSITGNNFGAGAWDRTAASLRFAVATAFVFCAGVEAVMIGFAAQIGGWFVIDPAVIAEVGRILPITATLFLISGPMMMIATHFQAVGDAPRAAILGLSKPYLFYIPLVFALALIVGGDAIWWAGPGAEMLLLGLMTLVLADNARRQSLRWGLFGPPATQTG